MSIETMKTFPTNLDDSVYRTRRSELVERALRRSGIRDERVLQAMAAVPRHLFVPPALIDHAYENRALGIGFEQTISQPLMVAILLEALRLEGTERVLDVGTGSGYQAALLACLAREVVSVDIIPALANRARSRLEQLGFANVEVAVGNGSVGYPRGAPYDAIVVAAAAPEVPSALVEQLAEGGTLVIPVGAGSVQTLTRVQKHNGEQVTRKLTDCSFVPLVGEAGFERSRSPAEQEPAH